MADNLSVTAGSGTNIASDEVTYSGDTAKLGIVRVAHVTGAEGSKTVTELVRLEDAAHTSGDPGIPALGVRQDTATSLAGTDGDYTMPIFDASGRQHVNVGTSALPTGAATSANQTTANTSLSNIDSDTSAIQTSVELIDDAIKTDDAAFTPGTTKVMMAGFEYDDTGTDSVDEGDAGAARMSANRNVYTQIRDAAGNERGLNIDANGEIQISGTRNALPITDNSGSLTVDYATTGSGNATGALRVEIANNGTGLVGLNAGTNAIGKLAANSGVDIGDVDVTTVGTITPGTAATSLGKAEDAVHSSGDVGVMALAIRSDTATATAADGDYVPLQTDSAGKLHVNVGNTVTVASHAVTNAGTFAVQESGSALTALQLIDDVVFTDDAAYTPGTSKLAVIGAQADNTATDSVDEGDAGALRMTLDRKLVTTTETESNSLRIGGVAATVKFATIAASSSGANTIVAAVTSKKIRVLNYVLVSNGTVNAKWVSVSTGDISGLSYLVANTGVSSGYAPTGHFETTAGEALSLNLSGAVAVGGHISYIEV